MIGWKYFILGTIIFLNTFTAFTQDPVPEKEIFPLFESKSIIIPGKNTGRYVPVIGSYVHIPSDIDLKAKMGVLADTLSTNYFNSLEIEIISIDSTDTFGHLLTINLKEPHTFKEDEPHPGFTTWHAFFQGSSQGIDTRITLVESFLQRFYNGEWIDALQVNYQGEPIYEMDHINLSGVIRRYK